MMRKRKRKLFVDEVDFDFLLLPVLQFALTNLLEWATVQRVSKVFKRCARRPQALTNFTLTQIGRHGQLAFMESRLGPSVLGVRALKMLPHQGFTDLQMLNKFVALRALDLCGCFLYKGDVLRVLAPLVALRTLNLRDSWQIEDESLQALAPLVALQALDLSKCLQITNDMLWSLAPLVALQTLNLSGCTRITDSSLQALAPLVALQSLDVSNCHQITGNMLWALDPLVALQTLNISGCNIVITDSQALSRLFNLKLVCHQTVCHVCMTSGTFLISTRTHSSVMPEVPPMCSTCIF
jgi:hypothetical protein